MCPAPRLAAHAPGEAVVRCDGRGTRLHGAPGLLFGRPIDVNRAGPATLEALPGIGPARARAVVAERARRPFCRPGELSRVPGIGPRTVARLRGLVSAGCAAAPAALGAAPDDPSPSRPW